MFIALRQNKKNKIRKKLMIVTAIMLGVIIMSLLRQNATHSTSIFTFFTSPTPSPTLIPTLTPTLTPTNTPTPTMTPMPTLTPTATPTPTTIPTTSFESYFDEYSEQYKVNKELLKKIAFCESGINPAAVNGQYGGMYQFSSETWQVTRKLMGADANPDLRFGAKEAIETAAYKIANGGQAACASCL